MSAKSTPPQSPAAPSPEELTPLEHRRQVAELRAETEALEIKASQLQSQQELLQQQYKLLTSSASWTRAFNIRASIVKPRDPKALLRPIARWASRYWRKGIRHLGISSVEDARNDGEMVHPTGSHPRLYLSCLDDQPLPNGWVLLELNLSDCQGTPNAVVVSDDSLGFSMHSMFSIGDLSSGYSKHLVRLPHQIEQLRLDIQGAENLRFASIKATHLGQIQLLAQLLKYQPGGLFGAAALVLKKGIYQAKIDLLSPIREGLEAGYRIWAERFDSLDAADHTAIKRHIETFDHRPLLSLVMPTYNSDPDYLAAALDSVQAQLYPHWELCIADDCSPSEDGKEVLRRYAAADSRIKITFREENGNISAATNSALELVEGEFAALMDHDDILPVHALYRLALELQEHPDTDIIYTGEDKIDEEGHRWGPYFKPDWNYDLFLGQNMVSHLGVYRSSLLKKIGGFQLGYEGSQDYDLAIRALEATSHDKVRHIPDVLYHWRVFSSSGSFSTTQKSRALATARQSLIDHERRTHGRDVTVEEASFSPIFHTIHHPLPAPLPGITLLPNRPFANTTDQAALTSLRKDTNYAQLTCLWAIASDDAQIAENEIDNPQSLALDPGLSRSAALNALAASASGDYLCFLAPTAQLVDPDWLSNLLSQAHRPDVGAVGGRLLDQNDSVFFAGYCLDPDDVLTAPFRGADNQDEGYNGWLGLPRNVSALSWDCLLISKKTFLDLGGFDAEAFPDDLADADFCLRLWQDSQRLLWTPETSLKLPNRSSHPLRPALADLVTDKDARATFRSRWSREIDENRFFNPYLVPHGEGLDFACPPRLQRPWRPYLDEQRP